MDQKDHMEFQELKVKLEFKGPKDTKVNQVMKEMQVMLDHTDYKEQREHKEIVDLKDHMEIKE